tara:strand:- start:712 stop:1002 length:291 start_codon:yes stop_codon:yes gene_type:complete
MFGSMRTHGGTRELELDFTSNYARLFARVLGVGGIENLNGMTGADAGPVLEYAARRLKDNPHPDHWKATEGNVKTTLLQLATMSRLRPDGVWWVHA